MQNMAEVSAEMHAGAAPRTWERNVTRQAILDAARRLAAHGGAEAITLSGVAAEAGFAPPAVYAYFVSKDDLYLAVVADDLNKLARAMRGEDGGPKSDDENSPAAGTADEVAAEVETEAEAAEAPVELATSETDGVTGATHEVPVVADAVEPVSAQSVPLAEESEIDAAVGAEVSAPAADEPAAQISLAEIEQAMGVVLASPEQDYAADAPAEDVPDAFPEDAIENDEESQPEPAGTEASTERRADPRAPRLRARWRRPRGDGEKKQFAMPLEETSADTPQAAVSPKNAEETVAAIAELQQAVARLESRPADAWLERRLRVFERTLADIEARIEKAERDSSTALSTVSDGFKALEHRFNETLDTATQRGSESEQRQRAMTADLRSYVKDMSGRLSALEKSISRMLGDGGSPMTMPAAGHSEFEAADAPPDDVHDAPPHGTQSALHDDAPAEPRGETYLNVARRAAISAAAQAEGERKRGPLSYLAMPAGGKTGPGLSRRTLQLVAGGLTLVVLLIVASIALRNNAGAPAAAMPAAEVTRTIAPSPDERVVALAKAGNPKAELVVALKLLNGDGIATDVPTAARWLQRAAVQEEPVAQYWLGTLYERGRGVAKDDAKAMHWYGQAAEAGNAKAMYRLGVAEAAGWNGEPDYVEAGQWFTKAATLGVIDAQFNLAVLYERGSGVPQSLKEAFKWYAIAAARGDAESKSRIDALASQITSDDVTEAQADAAKFAPAAPDPEANVEPDVGMVAQSQ